MGARVLSQAVAEPWLCCGCGHVVRARAGGRNLPCRCVAGVALCWPACCDEAAQADAFQAALEADDQLVMAQRRADAVVEQAEAWRPGATVWILLGLLALLLFGAFTTLQ